MPWQIARIGLLFLVIAAASGCAEQLPKSSPPSKIGLHSTNSPATVVYENRNLPEKFTRMDSFPMRANEKEYIVEVRLEANDSCLPEVESNGSGQVEGEEKVFLIFHGNTGARIVINCSERWKLTTFLSVGPQGSLVQGAQTLKAYQGEDAEGIAEAHSRAINSSGSWTSWQQNR